MPRRDWPLRVAIKGCLIVTMMMAGVALSRGHQNAERDKPHHTNAEEQDPTEQLALFTIKREKPVEPNWAKPNCDQPRDHDEADICQQIQMSRAAKDSAYYSFVQMLIAGATFFGLVFTILFAARTARAALDAATHGREAAAAARDSASLARGQITLTERNAKRELRAYISVRAGGVLVWQPGYDSHARIYVHNFGQTPAYNVVIAAKLAVIEDPPENDITGTAEITLSGDMHIAPGQYHISAHEKFFGDLDMEDVTKELKWFAVYGYVKYTDAFDVDRETRFIHLYRGKELGKEYVRYHHIGNSAT